MLLFKINAEVHIERKRKEIYTKSSRVKEAEVSGALCAGIEHAWDCINTNHCVIWEAVQKNHLESSQSSSYISGLLDGMKVEFQINRKYGVLEKMS